MLTRRGLLISASSVVLAGLATAHRAQAARPSVKLYKNPGCECCDGYANYLRQHGFTVTSTETTELSEIGRKAGVPTELQGCHTSLIGDQVVEGHVPIEAIEKLLAEKPKIKGIALAGMPTGSPGMSGDKIGPFTIHAIGIDGKTSVYMTV
jgi:hypothetical protein